MSAKPATTELGERLKARIRAHGPMGVDAFMAACLWDEAGGYYRRADVLGRRGDFVTAPEMTQVFGELLGLWAAVVWEAMGRPEPLRLVELGPGRGTAMADALRAARRAAPAFAEALHVHLVERSPGLKHMQEARLEGAGVPLAWHGGIEDVPPGASILLANEFLDALPVRQFVHVAGRWCERLVGLDDHARFAFVTGPAQDAAPEGMDWPKDSSDGAIWETRALGDIIDPLARRARDAPLAALFIDYGHERTRVGETLQAVRGHRYASALEAPGAADLSAHVDFEALARAAHGAGLAVDGPMPQAAFLGALGMAERAARLMRDADPRAAQAVETAVARLMAPQGMGGRFKAMVLRHGALAPPPPFAARGQARP